MEFLFRLYNRIFGKVKKASIPSTEKEQIMDVLNDMINQVETGTAKIDDQISELNEINRIIDKAEERAFKRDTAKKIDDAEGGLLPPVGDSSALTSMLKQLADKTGLTPVQIRRSIVDNINAGYAPNDPKRMKLDDNERLEAFLQVKMKFGDEDELLEDVMESFYRPMLGTRDDLEFTKFSTDKEPKSNIEAVMDDDLKATKQQKKDLERAEELMADIENFGKSFDEIMQMVQDEKVIPFIKYKPNPKPKKAKGGRIHAQGGGLGLLLKALGMKAPDKIADVKQMKNVVRSSETDLTRLPDTPKNRPTIDEVEQMVIDDPRYKGKTQSEMLMKIDKEKISYTQHTKIDEIKWKKYNVDYIKSLTILGTFSQLPRIILETL